MKKIVNTLLLLVCFGLQTYSQNINQELLEAIKLNSYGEVTNLIAKDADVNMADGNGASALMWAVFKSDIKMVKLLVSRGANVTKKGVIYLDDSKTGYYGSPLCIAAGEGKLDIVKYFHEDCKVPIDDREFNPSDTKETGWTALQWACNNMQSYGISDFDFSKEKTEDYSENNMSVVKYLLHNGANINQNESIDKNTPLLLAIANKKWDLVNLLLKYNPDIKLKNQDGNSALHFSAMYSNWSLINTFLYQKENPNQQNNLGLSPLMCCVADTISGTQIKIMSLRLLYTYGANMELKNSNNENAISIANQKGDKEVIKYIQNPSVDYVLWFLMGKENEAIEYAKSNQFIPNQRYIQNYSFLDVASLRNDTTLMKILISKGEKFDVPGYFGYSSLMGAVQYGGNNDGIDAIKLLIQLGANVNYQITTDDFKTKGTTALHIAASNGKLNALKVLIEKKANVNIVDQSGNTPIMCAVQENKIDCIKLLLYYHADLNIKKNNGKTVLDIAKDQNNFRIIKLLTEKKLTDVDLAEIGIYSEKEIVKLVSQKNRFNIIGKNDVGLTILHVAVLKNMNYLVEYLLNNKLVAPDVCDNSGFSSLHYATRDGRLYITKLLLEHGADINNKINAQELNGWTPLMLAAYNNKIDIIKMLVYNKVDINIKNNEGKSALVIAESKDSKESIQFLNNPQINNFDLTSIGYVNEVLAKVQKSNIDVNSKDSDGYSLMTHIMTSLKDYIDHYKYLNDTINLYKYNNMLFDKLKNTIYCVSILEGDYPAYNKGLIGTYSVLRYEDFEIDGETELLSYFRKVIDKPKTLTLLKDGKIESYTFKSGKMGMQINAKSISISEKQKIIADYEIWKQNNK